MTRMSLSKTSSYILAALFLLLLLSLKLSCCVIACPEIEKQSLLSFKQSLKDPSNLLSSWNAEVDCCEWRGVFCSNITGHVHQLHLQNHDYYDSLHQGLSGKINSSLLNLKHLKYLDLSQNNFEETILSFIGSFASLEYLNLSGAGFYGNIPYNIGNLSNLHTLSLEDMYSEFGRQLLNVDSLEWLSGLSKLEHLNMNFVDLSKAANNWPEQVINKLPSLVELHLSSCSLNDFSFEFDDPIPPTIANTTKLKYIDLSINEFNSSIPDWLYSCKDLEFVDLSGNGLQNAISDSIANLTSLSTLDLRGNQLSGKIPREIGNLCKMKMLFLSFNKLEGEVSDSFGNMSDCFLGSLESLDLNINQLSGNLTRQFGSFKSLWFLECGKNSLSGVIPYNIGSISSLEYLHLPSNKLTGSLPESVGQLFNLMTLYISHNMLQGVVTETHFAHLSNLTHFSASGNNLTLKVSPDWIPPFELELLQLGSWNLGSGSAFPPWLESQKKNISTLDLSCTGISGNVPVWIWNIRFLNLSHNQLHGSIPILRNTVAYGAEIQYRFIYLSSNNFNGSLPRVGHNMFELDLSNNSFSGDISHFLCHMTNGTYNLRILHLGGNLLTGELPDCWMNLPSLQVLSLSNNDFSGPIPNSIGFLANLWSLNLYGNKFSGRIPFFIQNCRELIKVDLSDNAFDGGIPEWDGTNLSQLKFLILRSNKLSGDITSTICQLSSLQILDISGNKFSGVIPRCVQNFTAMATKRSFLRRFFGKDIMDYSDYMGGFLESALIATKGSKLHYDTLLALVTSIDLSNNNLSGNIPKEITSLVELRSLNLSGNHLTGLIPDGIGNMKQLDSLDLSRNSLSGQLPSSFSSMTYLSYLNLSCNNLSGKIPESTQLQGFKVSCFTGNNLCGPPLTTSCSIVAGQMQRKEGDNPKIEWLYVFVSLGYAVGLSGFLTTLYLKKDWRDAYYEFFGDMRDNVYVNFYVKWTRFTRALGRNL